MTVDATGDGPRPIDLRIVVDGASTAGKTTTARSLGERLGRPVHSPEEQDGRTLLFDWMDHEGGRSDGRPIRTQVVAVPGHLPHLRARLLVTADVVLFVADTSASGIRATEIALEQVRVLLDAYEGERPGLVVQANKRDAADALPMDEVLHRLALDGDDPVIETVALSGEGVRQSYVYAVRLGLRHARAVEGPRIAERQVTADALLRELDRDPRPVRDLDADPVDADDTIEPDDEPAAESDDAIEPDETDETDDVIAIDVVVEEPVAGEPALAVEDAGSGVAEEAAPDLLPSEEEESDEDLGPRTLETVGAPAAPSTVLATDRPEHDHPRAWRRWFDR